MERQWRRSRITIQIATALAWLFALGCLSVSLVLSAPAPLPALTCMDEGTEKRARALVSEAIDQALRDYVEHLFATWVRDPQDQPQRASTGIRHAVTAYVLAHSKLDDWHPPRCPATPQ
jgi:hypothetical protein